MISPDLDPYKLSIEDKVKLVQESDGLLIELLENETIKDLYLEECFSLTHFPDGLSVLRHLDLRKCYSLTHIPDGLVKGYLYLEECTSLTHLPEGLSVKGNLFLIGCSSLTHLPEGLSVAGNLYLIGCTSLPYKTKEDLPKSIKIGGEIY